MTFTEVLSAAPLTASLACQVVPFRRVVPTGLGSLLVGLAARLKSRPVTNQRHPDRSAESAAPPKIPNDRVNPEFSTGENGFCVTDDRDSDFEG